MIKAHPCRRRLSHLTPFPGHAGAGGARNWAIPQNVLEHLSWHRDLGHLERNVTPVANHLGADLDQLLP
jgi:hypothetical protein